LIKQGSKVKSIYALNIFEDIVGDNFENISGLDKKVFLYKKYYTKLTNIQKILEPYENEIIPSKFISILDAYWFDNSDMYDNNKSYMYYAPKVYEKQFNIINSLMYFLINNNSK